MSLTSKTCSMRHTLEAAAAFLQRLIAIQAVRDQPFFDKMYGDCQKGEVKPKLVHVDWLPQHGGGVLRVTSGDTVAED